MSDYSSIDKALNIESEIIGVEKNNDIKVASNGNDVKKDYEYTRANLYSLIEKGQEAINGIMELAGEGGSPRAYEVAGQLIKSVGDVTDKLIDLQKKLKDVEEETVRTTNNVTNNAVFVGSTSELSKILKQGFLNNKE
ncbi:MAG: terminase small subunit [Candidatus Nanopelagicales bacterium]